VRGLVHGQEGAGARAIADYSEALRLDPRNVAYLSARGNAYRLNKDLGHALADLNEAIQRNGKDVRAYAYRGEVYAARKEWDRTIAD